MKKRMIPAVLLAAVLVLSSCGQKETTVSTADGGVTKENAIDNKAEGESGESIKIGIIYSATGNMAGRGEYMKEAIEMAVEEINASGGLLGGRQIQLVVDDDQSDQTTAINMMNKMGSDSSISAVFGPHTSTNATAVSDTVKQFKIPYFTGGTSAKLKALGNEYMFKVRCNDEVVVNSAIKYMTDTLGVKKLGILYINDEFGVGGRDIMVKYCEDNSIEYVEANHNASDQDLTSQIMQMKQAGVEGMIAWSSNVCPIVARQTTELGFDKPILMNSGFGGQDVLDSLTPEVTEGKMAAADFTAEDPDPIAVEFVKKFSEKYGKKPLGDWAASYYGGVYALAEAIEASGSTDREAIKDAMYQVKDLQSPLGILVTDEYGCLVHECSIIMATKQSDGKCTFQLTGKVREEGF